MTMRIAMLLRARHLRPAAVLALALVWLMVAAPALAQGPLPLPPTPGADPLLATPEEIAGWRESAAKASAQAEVLLAKAAQARATAQREQNPARRAADLERARQYDADALELEAQSRYWTRIAAEEEARADRMERARRAAPAPPPPVAAAPPPPAPKPSTSDPALEDFLGMWREVDQEGPYIVEQTTPDDPAQRDLLTLTTGKRKWPGTFIPGRDGKPTRLHFYRTPGWEELNPEIPEWARQQVAGKVEWQLQLEAPEGEAACLLGDLKATWYPGEIEWTEGEGNAPGTAAVIGPGTPVELKLTKAVDELELHGFHAPRLVVYTDNIDLARLNPIASLIKRDRFQIEVTMSREEAQRLGPKIRVHLRASPSGAHDTVEMETTEASMRRPVVRYRHEGKLTIADYGDEPNRRSVLGPIPALSYGDRLAMSVGSGEEITVSLDDTDAAQSFRIYDSWIQRGIAGQLEAMEKLGRTLNAMLSAPGYDVATRQEAQRRFELIRHAQILLAETDQIHDYVRYWVGVEYRRLLLEPTHTWLALRDVALLDSGYGFLWVSREENAAITRVIRERRDEYRGQAVLDLTRAGMYALYSFIASTTMMNDIYMLFGETDAFGNRVDRTDRLLAALNIAVGGLTIRLAIHFSATHATSADRINRLGNRAATKESVALARARGGTGGRAAAPGTPTPSRAPRVLDTAAAMAAETGSCSSPGRAGAPAPRARRGDPAVMKQVYPKAEIVDAPTYLHEFHNFEGPNCRFVSQDVAQLRITSKRAQPERILSANDGQLLRQQLDIEPKGGQIEGASNKQMEQYVSAKGGNTWNVDLPTRDLIELHQNDWAVTVGVLLDAEGPGIHGFHQVALWDVEYGMLGRPTKVVIHDSNYPRHLAKLGVCDFNAIRARRGQVGLMRMRRTVGRVVVDGHTVAPGVEVGVLEYARHGAYPIDLAKYD